ncbi:MAG TPA: aspartyl protease family protein [Candidatus Baltobacteraceae bacterium]|nr:aspartyl protease family protein [Candidatus Baltobacteraceae bacterium]
MAFAVRFGLLFAVAALTVGAAPPHDSLAEFLAAMRLHSGPVWSAHLASVSHVTESGETVDLKSESQGLRFVSYDCTASLCEGTYFDGERLYSININGTMLPQAHGADPFLRAERTIASLSFLAPDFAETGGHVYDDGLTLISNVPYRTLLVTNGDATPMLVYVDPKTFAVAYMRDVNADTTIAYDDYVPVGERYQLPLEVYQNGALLERYDRREPAQGNLELPRGLVPTFSSRPATVATDQEYVTPIFPCTLSGVVTKCLLDSGNSGMAISPSLAQQIRAQAVGSFQVRGLGNYTTEVVHAGELRAGSMTLPPANYVVLRDIDRFGYQVVLGADVFAATTVELNNASHQVVFGAPVPPRSVTVPLAFEQFVPVVDVLLGSLPAQLALDTGDESSINLAYDFYQAHRDLFPPTSERPVEGVGGTSVEILGTIPQVEIGNLSIRSSTIGATQTLAGTALGHLGAALLSRFDVTIDYASSEIHFIPLASDADQPANH